MKYFLQLDQRLAQYFYEVSNASGVFFFTTLTHLADAAVLIILALLCCVLLRNHHKYLLGLFVALISSEGFTYIAKIFFHRDRPPLYMHKVVEDSFSFPSGHATGVVAFYGYLVYLIFRHHTSWKIRSAALVPLLVLICVIDVSRMYLGVHYLSDVIAGNFVGLCGILLAIVSIEWYASYSSSRQQPSS